MCGHQRAGGGRMETERHQPDFTMNEQPNAGQMAFSLVGRMKGVGLRPSKVLSCSLKYTTVPSQETSPKFTDCHCPKKGLKLFRSQDGQMRTMMASVQFL